MENEAELEKQAAGASDEGYSEQRLAKQVDLLVTSMQAQTARTRVAVTDPVSQVFTAKKKSQTLFQAQKDEEK
jgi:hypothetical protein